jgi:hypothetical protein
MAPSTRRWLLLVAPLLAGAACVDAYCQSGSKYGTQCYSSSDLPARSEPAGTRPADAALFRRGPPAQGHVYRAPPTHAASGAPSAAPPPSATPTSSAATPDAGAR